MSIRVACQCGQRFAAEERLAGRTLKCPKCGQPLKIPHPKQPKPELPRSEPLGQRDAVADLLDEAGMDGSIPVEGAIQENRCPGCGSPMPPGAIVCVHCGYSQKLGRKITAEQGPADKPATGASSAPGSIGPTPQSGSAAHLAAVWEFIWPKKASLRTVAMGLNLLLWGWLLSVIMFVLPALLPFVLTQAVFSVVIALLPVLRIVPSLLRIVGWIQCLHVPEKSRAG